MSCLSKFPTLDLAEGWGKYIFLTSDLLVALCLEKRPAEPGEASTIPAESYQFARLFF